MKTAERNVVRLAVVQHLRSAFGIKTKNWNKCKSSKSTADNRVRSCATLSTPLSCLLNVYRRFTLSPSVYYAPCALFRESLQVFSQYKWGHVAHFPSTHEGEASANVCTVQAEASACFAVIFSSLEKCRRCREIVRQKKVSFDSKGG